jgi:hypothetical protein
MQGKARARRREQQAEASERATGGGAVEERGVEIRVLRVEREKPLACVSQRGQFANDGVPTRHAGSRTRQRRARKISVPLVPPNPKELLTAVSIFICRAVFGT